MDTLREAAAGVSVPQEALPPGGENIFPRAEEGRSKVRPAPGFAHDMAPYEPVETARANDEEGHGLKRVLQGPASAELSGVDSGHEKRQQDCRTPKRVRAALLVLNFYKVWLSPLLAGSCRYQPTCSRYAYEAIERFGLARGLWLGTKRLLRCHPFTKRFGYDPVPEKWEEMGSHSGEKQVKAGRPEELPVRGGVRS